MSELRRLHITVPRFLLRLLVRFLPFYRGGVRLAQSPLFKYLSATDEILLTRLKTGPRIMFNINDYIGRSIYYWGDYDRKITHICKCILKEGDCFLDIGANIGDVGLSATVFVGLSGQVHFFEPQPHICNYIRKSIRINHFNNAYVHEIALSDREGECLLSVPLDNVGAASLEPKSDDVAHTLRVRTCNASEYFGKIGLPRIKAIKLDVEGHEEKVLAGAYEFLEPNRPVAVIFESHDNGTPFFERGEVKLLSELNYSFFQIRQRPLFKVELLEITSNSIETGYDFVALLKSEVDYYRNFLSIV